ncbi:L-threonylcarbamoyladenylate synthase [Leptospira ilyithenensis]|uniref:Threonylcarbamoyl-AMP synthase n=1 Tax=Leptospira ilyithenensis TaxID=2484901 RepID=A0A4R9LLB1_9LEPT|nr:L-threonylcarbamoyladenylate synthase [Leptospira ilyithenensis]TGN08416.1 threonylcarbamoyl-AMP synthase [Leptospira ilyithenensis]
MKPTAFLSDDPILLGKIIERGGVVVFPTETVYGIGASSLNFDACRRIYQIKNRPSDNPLIAHFANIEQIRKYCVVSQESLLLLETFSPGPLTLVLEKKNDSIFPPDRKTIAVRIPSHPAAMKLIEASGVPISAPSANLSGKPSFTRKKDVIECFQNLVDGILLADDPEIGIESTVVDMTKSNPILLRPGKTSEIDLRSIIPHLVLPSLQIPNENRNDLTELVPESPGMKYRHYSPEAKVVLLDEEEFLNLVYRNQPGNTITLESVFSRKKIGFIGFGFSPIHKWDRILATNEDYMKELYSFFVDADKLNLDICYCEIPKDGPDKYALMNRLEKAKNK